MDTSLISHKREEIKKAFNKLCECARKDQKLCDQIKDRGFWKRRLAKSKPDLARAGMSQLEVVGKLQQSLNGLMEVCHDATERERKLISLVDELRQLDDERGACLCDAVGNAIRAVVKEHKKIESIVEKVAVVDKIAASNAAASKCATVLRDYCKKATHVDEGEFWKRLAQTIQENFIEKGISLRSENKQFLVRELSNVLREECGPVEAKIEDKLERISPEGEKYTEFRDELVGIIDDFVKHRKEVDPQGRSIRLLTSARNRLMESQFEIALIGEFQGGKSTTFNALCGGREISPRGLGTGGIKTSAAVITAQNIAGDETRNGMGEWAEITWLTKAEIQSRIAYVLDCEDREERPSLAALEKAVKTAWKNWAEEDDGRRDMLKIATLQLRLLKSKEFDSVVSQNVVAIDEFQKYVRFPKDWESRWGDKGFDADFTMEESLFAALDSVLVRIHSECLQRLGCRITDCPGLFVSKWDTDRALEVMGRANAVWYLLNGNKEMGQEQKRVLQSIRQGGWHAKCFFTLNARGDEASTDAILRANVAKIKCAGFNVENRVFRYNAAISFRLAQLVCISSGKFGRRDVECLASDSVNRKNAYSDLVKRFSEDNGCERIKAVRQLIYNVLAPIGFSDSSYYTMTDEDLSDELEELAGLKNIVRSIERHVISRGAASILLGCKGAKDPDGTIRHAGSGAELCRQVLEILHGDMKSKEEAARLDFAAAKKRCEEDERRFEKFKSAVEKEFRFLDENKSLDDDFLNDFYKREWKSINDEVTDQAIEITIEEWHTGHLTNTKVKSAATKKISEMFSRRFKLALNAYAEHIADTDIYQKEIGCRIRDSWKDLMERWDEMARERPHFEGLCPDEKCVEVEIKSFEGSINQNIEVPSYSIEFLRNIGGWIVKLFHKETEGTEERIKKYFVEEKPIEKALNELKDSLSKSKPIRELFAQARIQNKEKIDASMRAAEQKFEERISKERSEMNDSADVRRKRAKEACRVREGIIEPRITRIDGFTARVKASYGC